MRDQVGENRKGLEILEEVVELPHSIARKLLTGLFNKICITKKNIQRIVILCKDAKEHMNYRDRRLIR